MSKPTALFISVDTTDYYRGYTVSINGFPIAAKLGIEVATDVQ